MMFNYIFCFVFVREPNSSFILNFWALIKQISLFRHGIGREGFSASHYEVQQMTAHH